MNLTKIKNESIIEELIPVYQTDTNIKVVNARELYNALGVKKDFSSWAKQQLKLYKKAEDYNLNQDTDYCSVIIPATNQRPKKIEYILTLDTAKELAMMSKCENGRAIRKYFIEVEKAFNSMVNTLSDEEKTPEQKIAEALLLAQDVLDKTKYDLIKANRNKAYNKKVNVELRRRIRELEAALEKAHNNPSSTHEDIQIIMNKLEKAEEQAAYWEGAYTCLEEKLDTKESQLMTLLTVRKDGRKYFNLLAVKHAHAIPERDENKKSMRANVFRKDAIQSCKEVKYSRTFASNFIEKIHPTSIPVALNAYLTALENRLGNSFESIIGQDLIDEIQRFLSEGQDNIDAVIEEVK